MDEWYWCADCEEGCEGNCGGGFYDDVEPEMELECPCCGSGDVAP